MLKTYIMLIVYKGQKKEIPAVFGNKLIASGEAELFQEKPVKTPKAEKAQKAEKPVKPDTEK